MYKILLISLVILLSGCLTDNIKLDKLNFKLTFWTFKF
jgi:hypothetical protein